MTTTLQERRAARTVAEARSHVPVVVVPGFAMPTLMGRRQYWTTLSGKTVVRFPSAYGWRTLYHHSTLRVEVGELWLVEKGFRPARATAVNVTCEGETQ